MHIKLLNGCNYYKLKIIMRIKLKNCDNFLNLDSSYARLRISKEWKTVLKILKDIL